MEKEIKKHKTILILLILIIIWFGYNSYQDNKIKKETCLKTISYTTIVNSSGSNNAVMGYRLFYKMGMRDFKTNEEAMYFCMNVSK